MHYNNKQPTILGAETKGPCHRLDGWSALVLASFDLPPLVSSSANETALCPRPRVVAASPVPPSKGLSNFDPSLNYKT